MVKILIENIGLKMRNLTLIILILLIILFAPSLKDKCTDALCALQKIEHKIEYSHKGTRSEAKHGYLSVNSENLPDVFTLVRSGDSVYKFYQRSNMWGMDGYFPVKEKESDKSIIKESDKQIKSTTLKQGWYLGKELLKGTPLEWLYTEWKGGSAYVSPDSVKKMTQTLKLKTIPRFTGFKIMPKKN
jgi:hypothetical protein